MKKIFPFLLTLLILASCGNDDDNNPNHCNNGIQDGNETGVDCGGSCDPCSTTSSYYVKGNLDGLNFDYQQTVNNFTQYPFGLLVSSYATDTECPVPEDPTLGFIEQQSFFVVSIDSFFTDNFIFKFSFLMEYDFSLYEHSANEKLGFIHNSLQLNSTYDLSNQDPDCFNKFEISYIDLNGVLWKSSNGVQPSSSNFIITEKIISPEFPNISSVIKFNFNIMLFDENNNSISITNGEGRSIIGAY